MKNRAFFNGLMLLSLLLFAGLEVNAQAPTTPTTRVMPRAAAPQDQKVVIYEDPDFEGRSRSFGVGGHRLFTAEDFNDVASSITVPAGLVVLVYEHADERGGFGIWVDFLEDQPSLSSSNFNNKISYLEVFSGDRPGYFWARNRNEDGRFVPGHWEGVPRTGIPVNTVPVPAPFKPPNVPEATTPEPTSVPVATSTAEPSTSPKKRREYSLRGMCSIAGNVTGDKREYESKVELYRDQGNVAMWQQSEPISSDGYVFPTLPPGKYLLKMDGKYTGGGRRGVYRVVAAPSPSSEMVECEPNTTHFVDFVIKSL